MAANVSPCTLPSGKLIHYAWNSIKAQSYSAGSGDCKAGDGQNTLGQCTCLNASLVFGVERDGLRSSDYFDAIIFVFLSSNFPSCPHARSSNPMALTTIYMPIIPILLSLKFLHLITVKQLLLDTYRPHKLSSSCLL